MRTILAKGLGISLTLAASLAAVSCTSSEDAPQLRKPKDAIFRSHNPKNRKLAERLIRLKGIDQKVKKDLDLKFAGVVAHLPHSHRTRFYDALRRKVNISTIREDIIDIYTESLDRDQLTRLVEFYSSDLGQFVSSVEPKLNSSILESLSSSSTLEAERILLEMIKEKDLPDLEANILFRQRSDHETDKRPSNSYGSPKEIKSPIRKALDKLHFTN